VSEKLAVVLMNFGMFPMSTPKNPRTFESNSSTRLWDARFVGPKKKKFANRFRNVFGVIWRSDKKKPFFSQFFWVEVAWEILVFLKSQGKFLPNLGRDWIGLA